MSRYPISRITNGQATVKKFNEPIEQILQALDQLSSRLDGMSNKSAVLQWDATISSDAALGDLVYFDSKNGSLFRPAIARLSGLPGSQGQSVLAPSSRVEGLLISTNPAVILRSGYYLSDKILNTLGLGALAGLYYLSPSVAGKATLNPGWNMRQPCISYYGAGKFSMITNYLAHDNHHHTYTKLTLFKAASLYTGSDSAQGDYVCEVNTATIGELSPLTSVVFYKGLFSSSDSSDSSDPFKIGKSTVWYTGFDVPSKNTPVYLFNVFPFAYGDSVVRSIGTDTLLISAASGAVRINIPQYKKLAALKSPTAVSSIYKNTLSFTPVVSKLVPSTGIHIASLGQGLFAISSSASLGTPIKAELMYMNGAQRVATSLLTYTVFPRKVESSATISLPVLNSSKLVLQVSLWAQIKADTACDLDVLLYWVPLDQEYAVALSLEPIATGRFTTTAASTPCLIYKLQQLDTTIAQTGTLVAKLIAKTPLDDIYIYQTGFKLDAVSVTLTATQHTDSELDQAIMDKLAEVLTYNANY